MTREELLAQGRKVLWAGLIDSGEEFVSAAPQIFIDAGMLVEEGGGRELQQLRARVAELEVERAAVLDDFIARCEVALSGCCSECDAATAIVRGRRQAALDKAPVPEWSADRLTALLAPTQALREDGGERHG